MKDEFTSKWIIEQAVDVTSQYEAGILTLRALHYQLVSRGMTNDIQHYKRVVAAMISARWDNIIPFDAFSDLDRTMVGNTDSDAVDLENTIEDAKNQIKAWMTSFHRNMWENQEYYPEILIEKKALQGVFEKITRKWNVALGACKGYPSLTFLRNAYYRLKDAANEGHTPIIIYFGDYDPSGEDIPRSIHDNLDRFGIDVDVRRIALMEHQVREWRLPPAPAKATDSRTANWGGLGQVELDAVRPEKLMSLLDESISEIFNGNAHEDLMAEENKQRLIYQAELRSFVANL